MSTESDLFFSQIMQKSKNKTRISSDLLFEMWFSTFPETQYQDDFNHSKMLDILKELQIQNKISLPSLKGRSWDRSIIPAFPKWIQIKKIKEKSNQQSSIYPWHPHLAKLSNLRNISKRAFEDLKLIDNFLKQNQLTELTTISLRERSFQIFNNEKRLEQLYRRSWFNNNVPPIILKISVNPEPFGNQSFCTAITNKAIILENVDTFTAFIKANYELENPLFRYIIYGKGHLIEKSILWIDKLNPLPSKLYYFGDIDQRGFTIPYRLKRMILERGFPFQFELALPFYQSVIDIYIKQNQINLNSIAVKNQKHYSSLQDLPATIRSFIKYLYQHKKRIPQEILTQKEIFNILRNVEI